MLKELLALLVVSPAILMAQAEPRACKSYEPETVTLHGTLTRKTFAGPPNYESVRKGDKPETAWFLELDAPICVDEDKTEPDLNPPLENLKTLELVLQVRDFTKYAPLVGRRVIAFGSLFGAHTAHHHTPVLLTVKTLRPAQGK